jgi:hypothetical protein
MLPDRCLRTQLAAATAAAAAVGHSGDAVSGHRQRCSRSPVTDRSLRLPVLGEADLQAPDHAPSGGFMSAD